MCNLAHNAQAAQQVAPLAGELDGLDVSSGGAVSPAADDPLSELFGAGAPAPASAAARAAPAALPTVLPAGERPVEAVACSFPPAGSSPLCCARLQPPPAIRAAGVCGRQYDYLVNHPAIDLLHNSCMAGLISYLT